MAAENQNVHVGARLAELANDLEAAGTGQPEIEHEKFRFQSQTIADGGLTTAAFADDPVFPQHFEVPAEKPANRLMVLGKINGYGLGRGVGGHGVGQMQTDDRLGEGKGAAKNQDTWGDRLPCSYGCISHACGVGFDEVF